VFALPTTRLAVMGPAGKEFVYKDELRAIRHEATQRAKTNAEEALAWQQHEEARLSKRYEVELMNPKEALSLGSINQIVMPHDLRPVLGENFRRYISAYQPSPMQSIQREFH
jgi:acetyl-CoA carboxylase carboxyltransferase component